MFNRMISFNIMYEKCYNVLWLIISNHICPVKPMSKEDIYLH